jgi:hypothetical protein
MALRTRVALSLGACALALTPAHAESNPPPFIVELRNHHPFPLRQPVEVPLSAAAVFWPAETAPPTQRSSNGLWLIAEVSGGGQQRLELRPGRAVSKAPLLNVTPAPNGLALQWQGREAGRLSWSLHLRPGRAPEQASETALAELPDDFHALFRALPLAFERTESGPVFAAWRAELVTNGLRFSVEARAFHDGFLDLDCWLVNESAPQRTHVYAAVVCRWEIPGAQNRTLAYDNRIGALNERDRSPFRSGPGRHQFLHRGLDWMRVDLAGGGSALWLNDFAPSFTVLDGSRRNLFREPRYQGANLPQLGQEVQTAGPACYFVTEIARPNIRAFRDRLAENVLPERGDGARFRSRIVVSSARSSDAESDAAFVGYTGYVQTAATNHVVTVAFGVPAVRFGTAYFPYSTLGENFDRLKLPGMDREAFWPLAADTVLRWREFADDIRRDLRLVKAMGFHLVRLHHLELLASIPESTRLEYLDFLFGELRRLRLKAMLDLYASPEALATLVRRYADVVESVELENEILIWGIPLDRPAEWKRAYQAIQEAAPHVQVHLTGYNNTGMFDRLQRLGVPFDRVALHAYTDSPDAIASGRGYALALASYAAKLGKPPLITEWNWRQFTRLSPGERARLYPQIFESALATRSIPELHQFQFNETLAPNLRTGRGNILRHYELLQLSRRLKPEGAAFMEVMRKYVAPDDPLRRLDAPPATIRLNEQGQGRTTLTIRNTGNHPLPVRVALESFGGVEARLAAKPSRTLAPGESWNIPAQLRLRSLAPGFYHAFIRIESDDGLLRYGWIEARLAGAPKLDLTTHAAVVYPRGVATELDLPWTNPLAVVYGTNAPVLEVETAIAIANTLESAIGQPVDYWQADTVPTEIWSTHAVILVGALASHPDIARAGVLAGSARAFVVRLAETDASPRLVVGGADSLAVEEAGMDLLLRWWRHAKDSAARRVGLAAKDLPRGLDPSRLP